MALQDKTEDWLLPFLEGAYAADPARQAACEARLAADPALTAEAAQMRQTLNAVRGVAARTPKPASAAVPADSWPRLKARLQSKSSQPVPARLSWGWLGGAGAAVAVAAGVLAVILPGHHPPSPVRSGPSVATAPRPASPAAQDAQKPAQVAQTAPPTKTPTGPLVPSNLNGLSDPFVTLPVPPPRPGAPAAKSPTPVFTRPVPKLNQRMALRDTNGSHSPEVISPLLPLPVPPLTAPAPAAPPLPVSPTPMIAPQARFERKMLALPTPAASPVPPANSAAVKGQIQTFSADNALSAAAPPAEPYKLPPPAAAVGGGFGGRPGRGMNRMMVQPRREAISADTAALLTAGTKSLAEAVAPSLWGKTEGMQQSNETLTDLREAGLLADLRARLEARRTQTPTDLSTGRMLAAVYDFSGTADAARHERERIAGLDGANGEDFFQLAQSEERAGNADAARAAYRRALTAPVPPTGFHAAIARQKAQ